MTETNKFIIAHNKLIDDVSKGKRTSPLKAIRDKCLDCCCWQYSEVNLCPANDCSLWYFRFGKNKSGKRITGISGRGYPKK